MPEGAVAVLAAGFLHLEGHRRVLFVFYWPFELLTGSASTVFVEPHVPGKRQLCLKDEEDKKEQNNKAKKDKKDKKDKSDKKDKKDKNDKHDKKAKQGRL